MGLLEKSLPKRSRPAAPLVKVRTKKSRCDWLTSNYHYRKYLKTRSQVTWDRYKTIRNEVNRQFRQAKASIPHYHLSRDKTLTWCKLNATMGCTRCHAPLSHYFTSKGTPPDESTVANTLIDHLSTPPATPTAFTNPTTPAPCSTTFHFSKDHGSRGPKEVIKLECSKGYRA